MYAEAAVDGSEATFWAPEASAANLSVDLGKVTRVSSVIASWTEIKPASYRILVSNDGTAWTEARVGSTGKLQGPVDARYVRVDVTSAVTSSGPTHPGLQELVVQ